MKYLMIVLVTTLANVCQSKPAFQRGSTEAESKGTQGFGTFQDKPDIQIKKDLHPMGFGIFQDKPDIQIRKDLHPKDLDEYFQHKQKRGEFFIKYWNHKSPECIFSGYAPNGPIVKIDDIKPPKATFKGKESLDAQLSTAGTKLANAADIAVDVISLSSKMAEAVPVLGPALGLFSTINGMVNKSPQPQDILNAVNDAITVFTDGVNTKLDQMEGYVDSSIAKAQKELIEAEYATAFRHWAQCIQEPTQDLANECQRGAADLLVASRKKFAPLAGKMSHKDPGMVRKLEAYMLVFRDYANLVIMELTPIVEYYCTYNPNGLHSAHYCGVYTDKMKNEASFFIKYAQEAVKTIKNGHWGTSKMGSCPNTMKIQKTGETKEGGWFKSHTFDNYKASCEIESSNTKKYCTIEAIIRADGSRPPTDQYLKKYEYGDIKSWEYHKAFTRWATSVLNTLSSEYQIQNHKIMDKYWKQEVLDFIPSWKKAIEIAEGMKKKNPNDEGKAENVKFDQASFEKWQRFQRHQRRLDASGHRFVDVEALEEKYAAEEAKKDEA